MKYGYCRVSTSDQTNDKFIASIVAEGVNPEDIVTEVISGTKSWHRRQLGELVARCEPGDEIVVPELSRLGRGAGDVLNLRDELVARDITVVTLKEGYRIGAGMRAADKMIITVMAAVNEMERDYISDRTKEGLRYAKTLGKQLGGYRGTVYQGTSNGHYHPDKERIIRAVRAGASIRSIAARFAVSRTSIYRWLRESHSGRTESVS